jgi:Nucleotidyl transferase AbiEii toxin, Type IV TA system
VKPRVGETALQALRHYLMAGVVERVARTSQDFVLRGGYLTRAWIDPLPRPTVDLDYVGDFAFGIDDTIARFAPALAYVLDDGIVIDPPKLVARGIWLETAFPGVHLDIAIGMERADQRLGIDIGFGDPLVPPAAAWENGARVVRPETQLAWKLHGLVEMADQWRPKDLADAWLIATRVSLDPAALPPAIAAAFESRGFAIAQATGLLDDARWTTKSARVRWASQRGLVLDDVIAELRTVMRPALATLEETHA